MRRRAVLVAVFLAGCTPAASSGGASMASSAVTASATPATPSPSPPAPSIVVMGQMGTVSQQPQVSHVVAVGLDGAKLAGADFMPPPNVNLGPAVPIYPPPIRVAGGRVYFTDGSGHVQQLTANGATPVATIPVPSGQQYTLSFGVSADGRHVVAAVNRFEVGGGADIFRADGGGTAKMIGHLTPGATSHPTEVVVEGFDGETVVAAVDTLAAVQNDPFPPGHEWMGGRLVTITAGGSIGTSYGGSDCKPYRWFGDKVVCATQINPDGMFGVTVRRGDGTVLLSVDRTSDCAVPTPDGKQLATRGALWSAGGQATPLPIDACPLAWLDAGHLLATSGGPSGFADVDPFVLSTADSARKALSQKGQFEGLASSV